MPARGHIFLGESYGTKLRFVSPSKGGRRKYPDRDFREHSERLRLQWRAIWAHMADGDSAVRRPVSSLQADGLYVDFIGAPGYELNFEGLKDPQNGLELANVSTHETPGGPRVRATMFIPNDKYAFFLRKLDAYGRGVPPKRKNPRYNDLMRSVECIDKATLASLWTDDVELMPQDGGEDEWLEIWISVPENLRAESTEDDPLIQRFRNQATSCDILLSARCVIFPGRAVFIAHANLEKLLMLLSCSSILTEIRRNRIPEIEILEDVPLSLQESIADNLVARLRARNDSSVAVTILDTGVTNHHPMLLPLLPDRDCYPKLYGSSTRHVNDQDGHGSAMAGVVAYGDVAEVLSSTDAVHVDYMLESQKIYTKAQGSDESFALRTEEAVALAEYGRPERKHIGCLAITTKYPSDGRPSSWSAALDNLAYGDHEDGSRSRLFVVSAGNLREEADWRCYPDSNRREAILDPAQAWNVVTVGAYTRKVRTRDRSLSVGYSPVAQSGGLSPFSRTTMSWSSGGAWAIKPDIVMEGGNVLRHDADGTCSPNVSELVLLSTKNSAMTPLFQFHNATSAATALAARFAARLQCRYSHARPETIRALMIHSATWTLELESQFRQMEGVQGAELSSDQKKRMLRFCGYGVPCYKRACETSQNALTLIREDRMKPFVKIGSAVSFGECVIYDLPWPQDELLHMDSVEVTMRVTLSYFIEPSPSDGKWSGGGVYRSHGLRFLVSKPNETKERFRERINKAVRGSAFDKSSVSKESDGWFLGARARTRGSISSDWIRCKGAFLASRHYVAVIPEGGWWRTRVGCERYDREVDYTLVVSLETPSTDIDLLTPVVQQIEAKARIPVVTGTMTS